MLCRMGSNYERIHAIVRRIPRRRVATYGQVAALAGMPFHARQVGYALHALPASTTLPWHRVINARGEISVRASYGGDAVQRVRLEREGVRFDSRGRVDLQSFQWRPGRRRRRQRANSRRYRTLAKSL